MPLPYTAGAGPARRSFEIWRATLEPRAARLDDVIRRRVPWTPCRCAAAEVEDELCRAIHPVNTIVQVSQFADSGWLVDTEVGRCLAPLA